MSENFGLIISTMESPDVEFIFVLKGIAQDVRRIAGAVQSQPPERIDPHQMYTRQQAAKALGVSAWLVDRARRDGLLSETPGIGRRRVWLTGESLASLQQRRDRKRAEILRL